MLWTVCAAGKYVARVCVSSEGRFINYYLQNTYTKLAQPNGEPLHIFDLIFYNVSNIC